MSVLVVVPETADAREPPVMDTVNWSVAAGGR